MTRMLFLISPVLFSGLYLLLGETIGWFKKRGHEKDLAETTILINTGRR